MKNPMLSPFYGTLTLAAALFLMTAAPLHAATTNTGDDPQFTTAIDDLPLMPGLTSIQDSDVLFVEPHEGRIAETEASGNVSVDDVYKFYRRSLPHLGWKVIDSRTYARDGEKLAINARADGTVTTVRFSIKPASR